MEALLVTSVACVAFILGVMIGIVLYGLADNDMID